MKKMTLGIGGLLIAAFGFAFFNPAIQAENPSFAEKFAAYNIINQSQETSGTYNFDKAHTFIGFRVKHYGLIEVPGYFRDFTGTVNYDANDPAKSSVEFTAKMTSVDTGVAPRDEHLRKPDFFEVEKYPEMTFKSTKIEKSGSGWMVTGDFKMKDVTKSISFPFNITGIIPQRNGLKMGITAETMINRRDFGVNYGQTKPGETPAIADDIKIVLQIEANKAQAKPAAAEEE